MDDDLLMGGRERGGGLSFDGTTGAGHRGTPVQPRLRHRRDLTPPSRLTTAMERIDPVRLVTGPAAVTLVMAALLGSLAIRGPGSTSVDAIESRPSEAGEAGDPAEVPSRGPTSTPRDGFDRPDLRTPSSSEAGSTAGPVTRDRTAPTRSGSGGAGSVATTAAPTTSAGPSTIDGASTSQGTTTTSAVTTTTRADLSTTRRTTTTGGTTTSAADTTTTSAQPTSTTGSTGSTETTATTVTTATTESTTTGSTTTTEKPATTPDTGSGDDGGGGPGH